MLALALALGIGTVPDSGTAFAISQLFASGEQGAWYDFSDLLAMFQDSAGTTPAALEQPVGKILDKSGRGNHAIQATSANRPVLSARVNSLTKTENFTDVAWTKFGTSNVSVKTLNLPADTDRIYQVVTTVVGVTYTVSQLLSGSGTVQFGFGTSTNSLITVTLTATPTLYTVTHTAGGTTGVFFAAYRNGTTSTTVTVDKPQLETGSTATRYQSVDTAAVYDTVGFNNYAALNGTNSSMTAATGGGGTAAFFLCLAVNPSAAGVVRTILSDAGTNTGYRVRLNASNQLELAAGNGTAYTLATSSDLVPISTTTLITAWDDGVNLNVQVGAGSVVSVARPVVSAGTAGFTLGADNGAATNFFPGQMYSEVYRQPLTSAAQRANVQAYCKSKAGL